MLSGALHPNVHTLPPTPLKARPAHPAVAAGHIAQAVERRNAHEGKKRKRVEAKKHLEKKETCTPTRSEERVSGRKSRERKQKTQG